MDSELVAVASTEATTMVQLLAADGWEQAKTTIGSLRRWITSDHPDALETQLAESRSALIAAQPTDSEPVMRVLLAGWESRLTQLLISNPQLADGLHRALDEELRPALAAATCMSKVDPTMRAKASGHGCIYQTGRDQHISEA